MTGSAIQPPDTKPCAFCAYLDERRPFTFVVRNTLTAVMVTREQRGKPHVLVIPVEHKEVILDLTGNECAALMLEVRNAAIAIDTAYRRPGISIWQNNGTAASQSIGHVHFHVAGTLDAGGTDWGDVEEISTSEAELIAMRLQASWPSPSSLG